MAYVRKKRVKRQSGKATSFYRDAPEYYTYYQLVEGYRENGKVRQRVLAHLGRYPTVEGAIESLQRRHDAYSRRAERLAADPRRAYRAGPNKQKAAEYAERLRQLQSVVTKNLGPKRDS
jgi:hypothetical protein